MKIKLVIIFLIIVISFLSAEAPEKFSDNFQHSLDLWINNEIDSNKTLETMNQLEEVLEAERDSWEKFYWLARTNFVRGQIYFENENSELSLGELEKSQAFAQKSIDIHDNSDSWRVLSEVGSLIMMQKGMGYTIVHFPKVREQAKKALELDTENARASLVIAQFLCNVPPIAGGNKKKGIKLLSDLLHRKDLIDEDRFYILLTLSEALQLSKQVDKAIDACREALIIFPGNIKGQKLLQDLQSK